MDEDIELINTRLNTLYAGVEIPLKAILEITNKSFKLGTDVSEVVQFIDNLIEKYDSGPAGEIQRLLVTRTDDEFGVSVAAKVQKELYNLDIDSPNKITDYIIDLAKDMDIDNRKELTSKMEELALVMQALHIVFDIEKHSTFKTDKKWSKYIKQIERKFIKPYLE